MTEDRVGPEQANAPRRRSFRDDTGRLWTVREMTGATYDRRGPSLVFECEEVVRRVRRYPAHWFELSEADLLALSMTW